MTVVTVSLRVMVVLIIISFGKWELLSECMQFLIAVGYSNSNSNSNTITDTVKDASEMGQVKRWLAFFLSVLLLFLIYFQEL